MSIDYPALASATAPVIRLRSRSRALAGASAARGSELESCQLLYAIKSNPCPAAVRAGERGIRHRRRIPGEVSLALACGCPPERILYTENNMTDAEQAEAIAQGY